MKQACGELAEEDLQKLRFWDAEQADRRPIAVRVVYANAPGIITEPLVLDDTARKRYSVIKHVFAVGPGYRVVLPESDYLGAVMTAGRTPEEALAYVDSCVESIKVPLRRDAGSRGPSDGQTAG